VTHHAKSLFRLTKNKNLVESIQSDFRNADIGQKDTVMLEYAEKLAVSPWKAEKSDCDQLRNAGFKDADILDIVQVAAYFSFVNRIASGLGVELEKYWEEK